MMLGEIANSMKSLKMPGMAHYWTTIQETRQADSLSLKDGLQLLIQAEKDKAAKAAADLTEANKTIETYKNQITELEKKAGENTDDKKQLEDLKAQIEKEKKEAEAKKADEQMTAIIRETVI